MLLVRRMVFQSRLTLLKMWERILRPEVATCLLRPDMSHLRISLTNLSLTRRKRMPSPRQGTLATMTMMLKWRKRLQHSKRRKQIARRTKHSVRLQKQMPHARRQMLGRRKAGWADGLERKIPMPAQGPSKRSWEKRTRSTTMRISRNGLTRREARKPRRQWLLRLLRPKALQTELSARWARPLVHPHASRAALA